MSVIQKIQEKYAKLMAIIIAIALITFVVMLAFENGGSLFRGVNATTIGKVNGKSIDYNDFYKKVEQQQSYMEQQGYGTGAMLQQQALDAAWNQEINQLLQKSELDKLGIKVGKKEMGDVLYGTNPPEDLKRQFTDSSGIYNAQMAKQQIDQVLKSKSGTAEQLASREQLISYIAYLENTRLTEKYNSLLANSANVPKWLVEKENADKSQMARISVVRDNYAANIDSTIKVSDKEIEEYISKHKDDFKQPETRSISYVAFSALPSAADSAASREKILAVKAEFDSTKDLKRFLLLQGSAQTFYDSYLNGPQIKIPVKDTIFRLPIGAVYGPYLDGGSYSIAKLLGVRHQPDTVKVRHILIATHQRDPQSGQMYPVRDSAGAKKIIDSVQTVIRNGSNFDTVCLKLSEDPGKNDQQTGKFNGGVYDNVYAGRMTAEFNDFIFGNPVGSKGVVKTEYGFHYIEILSQKGGSLAYKVAYVSKPIEVSSETESNAENEANQFAASSRDQKSFDANAEKLKAKGINKAIATDIAPMAYQLPGLGASRAFIKSIYKADRGDVLDPARVGDNYVVAVVTEVNEEGTTPVSKARINVEPLLRNKKVAEKLKQKLGTPATLEAAAALLGNKPVEVIDSLRMAGVQTNSAAMSLASEQKVIGAAFNPANKGKIVGVDGANGIYVVRVDNVMATAVADANVAEQRKARYEQAKQQAMYRSPVQALRNAAKIKDKRNEFF
jgi:peptidyl-prolyl cis-trans isomerase D